MELAWTHGKLTVKQALTRLSINGDTPAYSTVGTILSRLAERGLLRTDKQGKNFVYSPTVTKEQFLSTQISRVRACLKRNFAK